jgi:hypothetical protein
MSKGVYSFGYRVPRFRADFHLLLQTEDRQPVLLDGRCTDISEDGLGAQFRELLEVGSKVNLILTLPSRSTSLRVAARVTNRKGDFHGFAFVFSSQGEREQVQRYIESLRPAKPPKSK